jgi:hypothetical protein
MRGTALVFFAQMLDTCVRNCHPLLHVLLSTSLLWSDLLKLAQDTSVNRVSRKKAGKLQS